MIDEFVLKSPTFIEASVEIRAFLCFMEDYRMAETQKIYCPKCSHRVGAWDGRSKINVIVNCKNCNKRVIFDVETKETIVKDIPLRATSGGKSF